MVSLLAIGASAAINALALADIGGLMVSSFGKWLSPILIACHAANQTQGFMTTYYAQESDAEQE